MFDILKKRKSRRTVRSYSKMTKEKKQNSLLCSLFRMFKKKKKEKLVNETSDDKIRRKADEDCAILNGLECFNPGMRCSLTPDCHNLQVTENLGSMGYIVGDIKKKQHKQSCVVNGRVKELEDCERNMMVTKQDDHQKHVHIIIDSGTCKITVYSDGTYETEVRKKNTEKCISMRDCNNFQPETCDVEKNGKGMPMTFQLNICRSEIGQEDEQCNQKPTAIVLPTRHQTSTISEASSTTSVVFSEFVEGNTNELDESTMADTDGDTRVKTDENGDVHTVNSSSNMDPNTDNTFVKDIDRSSSILSCSIENNITNVPSLQERDNRSFEELNISSIVSVSSAGQEMVQETENVRNFTRNDSYSEDQKSRNENIKDAVTGIKMFDQTDVQHQDIQDSHLVHSDYTLYPPKSGHSPHSVRVGNPQEGNNASCHTQMFTEFDHEMKYSSIYDLPDSCITDMTATKLVQKVDHLESEISKLSKLVFAMMSDLRFPGSVKKQYGVIPEFQENCKPCFNDDDIISLITESSLQVASLLDNSFIHPECLKYNGHSSSTCVCLASIASDLKSLQYNGLKQLPQTTNLCIIAEEKSCTCSYSNNKVEAVKTGTMLKVQKDSKRGEPANQPTSMLMVERPVLDTRAESDEIGHTFYLLTNQGEDNLDHNMDIKESMEGQAEQSSLVVEINKIKSSKSKENCNSSEKKKVGIYDAKKHECGSLQFKDSEEKEQNHNEDKSRCLSEISLPQSIIIGHTNKTPMENTENDAQLKTTSNSTTPECARATDSRGYSVKDNTDTVEIPMMDDKPAFINSDADVSCLRESVKEDVNLETDETAVSTSKLNLEASDSCFNADIIHKSCIDQKETVVGLSSCDLKVKETACCFNTYATHAGDASFCHLVNSNVNVIPINTDHCVHFRDMDPVISDPEHIPSHGIPAQHEEYQQRQSSFGYSCDHLLQVQDKSKEEFTRESNFIQDSDPEQPRANKFEFMCRVQKEKLKETSSVLNMKKSQRRSKLGVNFSSLQRKRRGKKRKVKLKKNMELGRKVSYTKNSPRMLNDLKILLHYLTSSFAQDTVQSCNLTQATKMTKGKTHFATELGIVVSEKNNSSQESLIDDFLQSLVSTWFIFPTFRNGLQSVILLPTGLQLYFERLLRGPPPEERERMSYEWLRLQTFVNYPSSAPGSGIRLARVGFYYSGNGTVTVCYACGGQHNGWNLHDDPYEIHRRISPDCPFLRGNPTYPNVPIMQGGELNGIQMGNNALNTPLSQSMVTNSSNRISEMSLSAAFQSQNSTITQAQSAAAVLPSIHNSQEGESQQQASQQTKSKDEHYLGIGPSSINPASSAHVDEIPSVMHEPVTLTVAVASNTSGESLQGQQPATAASGLTQPQQPTDDAENTQYRNPGNFELIKPAAQVEDPGVDPTPQTMSELPKHPEYAPLSSRVNSYTGWPVRLDQTPQQMAEAGFYYAGVNDYTRCFQCGGGLRNWEPGDNPWIEHARWYPQCAYVLGKRGQRFVNAVLKKQAELLAAQNAEINNSSTTTNTAATSTTATTSTTSSGATSRTSGAQLTQEPATHSGQPRYFQNPNENEIANRLINEMGYQRERVREAILEVKRMRGQQKIAVENVIELLIADEERSARAGIKNEPATVEELIQESGRLTLHDDIHPPTSVPPPTVKTTTVTKPSVSNGHLNQVAGGRSSGQQQNGQKSGQTNQPIASGKGPLVPQSQLNMSGPMSIAVDVPSSSSVFGNQERHQTSKSTASSRPPSLPQLEPTSLPPFDADSLREEYMRLKDQNLCKICMERNVELAFLPCGHLVCCEICGQTLRFCPICRAKIHASVKTYLS